MNSLLRATAQELVAANKRTEGDMRITTTTYIQPLYTKKYMRIGASVLNLITVNLP